MPLRGLREHAPIGVECAQGRLIDFGAAVRVEFVSAGDEHISIGQERGGVESTPRSHIAAWGDRPASWIIQFGASPDKIVAIRQQQQDAARAK
jgi:hypothetical protein